MATREQVGKEELQGIIRTGLAPYADILTRHNRFSMNVGHAAMLGSRDGVEDATLGMSSTITIPDVTDIDRRWPARLHVLVIPGGGSVDLTTQPRQRPAEMGAWSESGGIPLHDSRVATGLNAVLSIASFDMSKQDPTPTMYAMRLRATASDRYSSWDVAMIGQTVQAFNDTMDSAKPEVVATPDAVLAVNKFQLSTWREVELVNDTEVLQVVGLLAVGRRLGSTRPDVLDTLHVQPPTEIFAPMYL